jgi:hypothetical protein
MKENIKASILSALVLPGLGQILSGRRLKGWILVVLSILMLIIFSAIFVYGIYNYTMRMFFSQSIQSTDFSIVQAFADSFQKGGLAMNVSAGAVIFIWIYSVLDALIYTESGRTSRKEN